MKKFTNPLFMMVAFLPSLVSCNKLPETPEFLPGEIYFADGGFAVETKAFTESTNSSLQTNGFNVAAVINTGNTVMFNKAVAYSNGAYTVPNEHYYFPISGTMSFYGAYPKGQAITVSNGVATLAYTHNADTDLIAAKATGISKQSNAVAMTFAHILSQVSIKAQGKDTTVDYKIKSVKITDCSTGTYAYADNSWTRGTTNTDIVFYNNTSGQTVSTSAMTAVGGQMSAIPGDISINVVWECYNKGTSTVVCSKDVTVSSAVTMGKHTTFNLTLPFDGSEITFTTSVGAWVTESKNIEMKKVKKPEMVSGIFTVNDSGKKVKFAKGNLYRNGSEFRCEDTQYAYPTTRNADHIGHFFWSKTASVAYAASYNDSGKTTSDKFFAADGGAIEGFTVLSKDEWDYLITNSVEGGSSAKQITIDGKNCVVLKPDGFSGTVKTTYTATEWAAAEASGLVALPFAGDYDGSGFNLAGFLGNYWSSTPFEDSAGSAWNANFFADYAGTNCNNRSNGFSVRLVSVQ